MSPCAFTSHFSLLPHPRTPPSPTHTHHHHTHASRTTAYTPAPTGITPTCVKLLRPRTISKTSSGKIARSWCKKAFLRERGSLDVLHEWHAGDAGDAAAAASASAKTAVAAAAATAAPGGSAGLEGDSHGGVAAASTAAEGAPTAAEALAAAEAAALASRSELEALLPPPPAGASVEQRLRYEIALLLAEEGELREPNSFELDDALVAFGLDSLRLTMLKGTIEREFEVEVPDEELYDEQVS